MEKAQSQTVLFDDEKEVVPTCLQFLKDAIALQKQMVELMEK
ncbi:hypothetical protein [Lentibacillus cibarius]|nr:hypothetical protein [Lentibacillus cibarius]